MDEKFMKRAIDLSVKGTGYTKPNPLVGAVIVKNNKIIGEGYHEKHGGPHAEINALSNVKENPKGAVMYVTLEPCSHYGKTPPCVNSIVKAGITEVVIAMEDPNPLVAGKGIDFLKQNDVKVTTGILKQKVRKINEIFIKFITTQKPFVILKTAMTLDGKISTYTGDSKWISNDKSRRYVHKLRHKVSGIIAGIGTVLSDDPQLTTRIENKETIDPVRIIIDSKARIPLNSNVLNNNESNANTIIATTKKADKEKIKQIGAQIIYTPLKNNRVNLPFLMEKLGEKGIDSVLIEGGSTLNFSALNEGIVDKVISFISPKIIGGASAKTPVGGKGKKFINDAIQLKDINISRFDEDIMLEGYLKKEV